MSDEAPVALDYLGLRCPLPVIRARKALRPLPPGREAVITSDDASAPGDFEAFCEIAGHELLGVAEREGVFEIRLRTGRKGR